MKRRTALVAAGAAATLAVEIGVYVWAVKRLGCVVLG
jgi:hypothetical protein